MLAIGDLPKPKRFRLAVRATAIFIGGIAAFAASCLIQENLYLWALLPSFVVLAASLAEFVVADVLTDARYPPETSAMLMRLEQDLKGYHERIHVAIQRLIRSLEGCDCSLVSGTFHLLVTLYPTGGPTNDQVLIQVVDYSGRLGGAKWRETPTTKGLVGRCIRTGRFEVVNFASRAEYDHRMVTEFGFTSDEVSKHTHAARSYCAQPVRATNRLVGVIYLFSTEPQVFPRSVNPAVLEGVSQEIAAFLEGARIV